MAAFECDNLPFICPPARLSRGIEDLIQLRLAVAVDTGQVWTAWARLQVPEAGGWRRRKAEGEARKGNPAVFLRCGPE